MTAVSADVHRADVAPPHAWGILRRMLRRHRWRVAIFCTLLVLWQICESLVPVMIGVVIDRAVATGDGRQMLLLGAGLGVLFLVLSLSYRFAARTGFAVMQFETHQLRVEIADHALRPGGSRTSNLTGEVLSLATGDAETVGVATRSFGYAVASSGAVIFSAVVLLRTDLFMGLVVLIGVPLTLGLVQLITPVIARRSAAQQASIARASGMATDFVRGLRILKGIGGERVAAKRYVQRSQDAREASIRTTTAYGGMQGVTAAASGVFLALVALLAGQRALSGDITIGQLIAVVGLAQFIAEPLAGLGHVGAQIGMAHASAGRIATFLGNPPLLRVGDEAPDEAVPDLHLDGVCGEVVRDLTLHARPGELVAIAVDDPAHASDLVALLTGEREPTSGAVRLAGLPIAAHTIASRRRMLLVNPHHTDLFAGTLRDNLELAGRLDPADLERFLWASATDDVVALHPDGLDQSVTAQGRTFSGGQQQRIALARALVADPPILVLHDPTSAVDAVTEHRIAAGIRAFRHGPGSDRITWLVTSSPALLAQADRVLLVRDGRVVREGEHAALSETADYRELVLR